MDLLAIICHGDALTLYHTITTVNDPETEGFWKPAFSPFPTMFSTLSNKKINFLNTFIVCKGFQFGPVFYFAVW